MSKELNQERVRELFDYDSENGLLIRKKDHRGRMINLTCGHKPIRNGYGKIEIDGKNYYTHRLIWLWVHGSWPDGEIDHLDRDRMNNRIENLRVVVGSENQHNHRIRRDNSSGFPGVYWDKHAKKYKAQIMLNNKQIHLGYFTTPEEAFLAYQLAKIEMHHSSPIAKEYLKELTLAG